MSIAKVVSVSATATADNDTVTTSAIDTTGANLLVAVTACLDGTGVTLSDSKLNSWTPLTASTGGGCRTQIFYVFGGTVGSGHTFTFAGTNQFPGVGVIAFSGVVSNPFDQENGAASGGANNIQTGSVTPSEDNEVLVTGMTTQNATETDVAIDSLFNLDQALQGNANGFSVYLAYKIQTLAGAENPRWTWTTSQGVTTRIATFKAAPPVVGTKFLLNRP